MKIFKDTKIGFITLEFDRDKIILLSFGKNIEANKSENFEFLEIEEYLLGNRKEFSKKYDFESLGLSGFQSRVLNEVSKIEYGETATYKEIAQRVGAPKAYRAVGSACKKNPLPIFIPCHRVVKSQGIGGYIGGAELKKFLLKLESKSLLKICR